MTFRASICLCATFVLFAGISFSSAADFYWDNNSGTSGAQGGTGTWNTSNTNWWNGANVAWTNSSSNRALFGSSSGTVTLSDGLTASEARFQANGYMLSAGSNMTLNSNIVVDSGASLQKTGAGVVTVNGDVNCTGTMTSSVSSDAALFINGNWSGNGTVYWTGTSATRYSTGLITKGIQFTGGNSPVMNSSLICSTYNQKIVIGAQNNTTLHFGGYLKADTTNDVYPVLMTGGKLVLDASARIDLLNEAYFTRQFWVYGDGTGAIEMAEGFVADRSAGGTVQEGLGSVRLSNATMITNATQNIPLGYRPSAPGGGPGANGHIVFENAPGGKWRVQTNPQTCISAVWINTSATVETITDLTHAGQTIVWGDYTGFNAFQIQAAGATLTKSGAAALNLNGEQAYNTNTIMSVEDGTVNYNTDPAAGQGQNFTNGQNLTVNTINSATANFNASLNRIKTLNVSNSGVARVASGKTLNLLSAATLNGGTLTGGGTLSGGVTNTAGNVNPGDISAKGTLAITGAYSQGASGKFTAEISSAGCDALSVSGAATLAGTIDSSLLGGFTPAAGTSYDVLTAGSISGTFSNAGVNITGGYLKANYTATKVSLLALRQGDSNGDKAVDVVDLGLLATSYGAASGATWQMGDYNHDGAVDVIDLGLLATTYGTSYGSTGDVVPEPSTLLMMSGFISLGLQGIKRRNH